MGAGRTDAGVHATGQVIAFDLEWRHGPQALRDALNANLPDDIAVWVVTETRPDFHPRYDALSRTYVYRLYCAPVRDPLLRWRAWHLSQPVDVADIQAVLEGLIGRQDFSAFGTPPEGENAVRVVYEARWETGPAGQHTFTVTANAFLYRMVRSIVGTLVLVGQGRMPAEAFRDMLADRKRGLATVLAPPHGLTLAAVRYMD
jgi:tRNA pseudouridine38-40 synthase